MLLCDEQEDGFKPSPSPGTNIPNYSAAVPVAEVQVKNKEWLTRVKVLFDTGAQKSFISKEVATTLNLPIVGQACLKISGFLTNNDPKTYDLVRPTVKLGRFKLKITAVVVPDMDNKLTIKGYKEIADFLKANNV